MASSKFGHQLDSYRRLREPLCVEGMRQSVVIINNPSTVNQDQQLLVLFPSLGKDNVIVPGTGTAFTIVLESNNVNRTMVQNLSRAIIKRQ